VFSGRCGVEKELLPLPPMEPRFLGRLTRSPSLNRVIYLDFYIDDDDDDSIQFNSLLFTCKLNSPKANYKVCTRINKNDDDNNNNKAQ
jgi:hypothetical protein